MSVKIEIDKDMIVILGNLVSKVAAKELDDTMELVADVVGNMDDREKDEEKVILSYRQARILVSFALVGAEIATMIGTQHGDVLP